MAWQKCRDNLARLDSRANRHRDRTSRPGRGVDPDETNGTRRVTCTYQHLHCGVTWLEAPTLPIGHPPLKVQVLPHERDLNVGNSSSPVEHSQELFEHVFQGNQCEPNVAPEMRGPRSEKDLPGLYVASNTCHAERPSFFAAKDIQRHLRQTPSGSADGCLPSSSRRIRPRLRPC